MRNGSALQHHKAAFKNYRWVRLDKAINAGTASSARRSQLRFLRVRLRLLFLPLFAALHRFGRELGLRLVAADDEHQDMFLLGLVVSDVHEAPRDANRERDHV